MVHSNVQCKICFRNMRSDNLNRHMKTHDKHGYLQQQKEIPTFDGSEFGTGKPKSKETMDKLRRHVLGDEAVMEPPTKTARMSSTTEPGPSKFKESKSQVVSSILDNLPSKQQQATTNEIVPKQNDKLQIQQPKLESVKMSTKRVVVPSIPVQKPKDQIVPVNLYPALMKCMKPKSLGELWCSEDAGNSNRDRR